MRIRSYGDYENTIVTLSHLDQESKVVVLITKFARNKSAINAKRDFLPLRTRDRY